MYITSIMIFNFSIRDFGHSTFLKSQFGHPVMKVPERNARFLESLNSSLLLFGHIDLGEHAKCYFDSSGLIS